MVARAGLEGQPRSFLATGALWPDGPLRPDAPVTIVYTIEIVRRVKASIADRGWSSTAAAEQIGMSRQSLQRILASEVVPDLHTLARAESSLGVRLWPV